MEISQVPFSQFLLVLCVSTGDDAVSCSLFRKSWNAWRTWRRSRGKNWRLTWRWLHFIFVNASEVLPHTKIQLTEVMRMTCTCNYQQCNRCMDVIIASYCSGACLIKTLNESKHRTLWRILYDLLKTSTIKTIPLKDRRVQESGPTSLVIECLQRPCGLSIMIALASVCRWVFWLA